MKSVVVIFPGTNREKDIALALQQFTGSMVEFVWHAETTLPPADVIILPGGFSYGDYLRCGAMAGHAPIMPAIRDAAKNGRTIIGICNGFQILTETGILPGALIQNAGLTFICKRTPIKIGNQQTRFTNTSQENHVITLPVAHFDGNYFADAETLARLEGESRVVFRYCTVQGHVNDDGNINGSRNNIAGIINAKGNVMGMMPHPENAIDPLQGSPDGKAMFQSLLEQMP